MKHFAAIFFLSILTFNWVGYRFVSAIMEQDSDFTLEANIDQGHYEESALVEIRIPLDVPYLMNRSASFERCYGEISIGDTDYKYVMRKVEDGELVLLCLPNEEKNRIRDSRTDFFRLVNDLNNTAHGKENPGSASLKSFTTVYAPESSFWAFQPLVEQSELRYFHTDNSAQLYGYCNIPRQPPRT